MNLHPIQLRGKWDIGWALDRHTLSSTYIGEDPLGNPMFDTERSEVGALMYRLKYQGDYNAAQELISASYDFLYYKGLLEDIHLVLPAPPTRQRDFQPAFVIARGIAEIGNIPYSDDALTKGLPQESKNASGEQKIMISQSVQFVKKLLRPCNILLVDDIFASGSTLNACVLALKHDSNAREIRVLTMTKTKGG